jgi:hypothetical protein
MQCSTGNGMDQQTETEAKTKCHEQIKQFRKRWLTIASRRNKDTFCAYHAPLEAFMLEHKINPERLTWDRYLLGLAMSDDNDLCMDLFEMDLESLAHSIYPTMCVYEVMNSTLIDNPLQYLPL